MNLARRFLFAVMADIFLSHILLVLLVAGICAGSFWGIEPFSPLVSSAVIATTITSSIPVSLWLISTAVGNVYDRESAWIKPFESNLAAYLAIHVPELAWPLSAISLEVDKLFIQDQNGKIHTIISNHARQSRHILQDHLWANLDPIQALSYSGVTYVGQNLVRPSAHQILAHHGRGKKE